MSLFDRRTLILLPLALAIGGCGFAPVYAPGGTANALYGQIKVEAPSDRASFLLVQDLEQRLGRSTAPIYELDLALVTVDEGQAITETGEITRYSLVGAAAYVLTEIGTDTPIATGEVNNFTGYSATGSTVETLASERDALERLMSILADQITTQLYSTTKLPD